jgi:hypothetical protein
MWKVKTMVGRSFLDNNVGKALVNKVESGRFDNITDAEVSRSVFEHHYAPVIQRIGKVTLVSALITSYQIDGGDIFTSDRYGDEDTLKDVSQEGSEEDNEEE